MKAPLRFMFGWVIYLGIFAAINYPMAVIWQSFDSQPLWLPVASAIIALIGFGVFFWFVVSRFWSWCDAPRSPDVQAHQAPQ